MNFITNLNLQEVSPLLTALIVAGAWLLAHKKKNGGDQRAHSAIKESIEKLGARVGDVQDAVGEIKVQLAKGNEKMEGLTAASERHEKDIREIRNSQKK